MELTFHLYILDQIHFHQMIYTNLDKQYLMLLIHYYDIIHSHFYSHS